MDEKIKNTESYENIRKEITFYIDKKRFTGYISLHELLSPKGVKLDEDFDYRQYVSNKLLESIENDFKPSIDQIKSQDDSFFSDIFDLFLSEKTDFYAMISKFSDYEICKRYAITYRKYRMGITIYNSIKETNFFDSNVLEVASQAISMTKNIDFSFLESIAQKIGSVMSWYSDNVNQIKTSLTEAYEKFNKIGEIWLSELADFIKDIDVAEYTEEEKANLIRSYKQWGKYGWTLPPNAYIDSFNSCPTTLLEADKYALQFCKKQDMEYIFSSIEMLCSRKRDLKEAIECYNHKNYKACALILFSIIDSRIIRLQNKQETYGVGIRAIEKFKKIAKQKTSHEGQLYLALYYENIFPCLFTMFANTDNFSKEMQIINRNYLDHGMSSNVVRKKDCIKLFLLLYNILEFIDIIK